MKSDGDACCSISSQRRSNSMGETELSSYAKSDGLAYLKEKLGWNCGEETSQSKEGICFS